VPGAEDDAGVDDLGVPGGVDGVRLFVVVGRRIRYQSMFMAHLGPEGIGAVCAWALCSMVWRLLLVSSLVGSKGRTRVERPLGREQQKCYIM